MFLKTIAPEEAQGEIAEIYRHELDKYGFVMDATRCMTTRPDLMPLVEHFIAALRDNFSLGLRGWRLITLIGNVLLVRGDSQVNGNRLVIDLDSGRAVIDGGPPGVGQSGGRVTGHFTVPQRQNRGS